MHYQEKCDQIFANGNQWKHRTLRTIFDPYSSEYENTNGNQKIEILEKILKNGVELNELIMEYKDFYFEENKRNVVDSVEDGLINLLSKSLKEK